MKKFKKASKLFLVAALVASFTLSVAACDTDNEGETTDPGSNITDPNDPNNPTPEKPTPENPGTTVEHTVKFVTNCDTTIEDKKVKDGESFTVTDPTNGTAIFLGWYTNSNLDEQYKYTLGTPVKGDLTLYAKWKTPVTPGDDNPVVTKYTVTFDSNGGSAIAPQTVEEGKKAFKPNNPELAGQQFKGWLLNGNPFSFDNIITGDITLVASWSPLDAKIQGYGAYDESLYVEWSDGAPSQASVQYRLKGDNTWQDVDQELIRAKAGANGVARVDVLGITAGDYDIKVQPSGGASPIELSDIAVTAYDRSGYAHFNYSEGVGAYYDDGTIKDNTLVIYVTDENKNTVNYGYVDGQKVDLSQYLYQGKGGIGWILNNRAYSGQINNYGITKLCNTYGAVAVRFIGTVNAEKDETAAGAKVSLIDGLTAYNSEENGGTKGDNGRMARMISAKNLTIEGIGEDATIYGWGLHLVNNDTNYQTTKAGSNFEVRNLTFANYPEDAIGMEGNVQEPQSEYTKAPVSHCWVHNNTFLPGYCASPAESDKAEGDGSCDFKRGEYFTLSYNYFTDCHKTNLIGASTKNYQYNITMHHNWWNNCGSRVPYVRNANVHFYNNYVSTADDGENDYVHDADGTSFIFSESNYYFNSKQITRGGIVKSWENTCYGCWGNKGTFKTVNTRDEAVSNSCVYRDGKSLANFDTDPTLFYYNTQTKQSDCLLDDSITARLKVMQYAGVSGWYNNNPKKDSSTPFKTNVVQHTPTTAVPVPDEGELAITMPSSKNDTTVNGVMFHNLSGIPSTGSIKGKGQIITFMLTTEAEVSFTASAGSEDYLAELVKSDGTLYVCKGSQVNVTLPAGTYSISSGTATRTGSNAKEVTISDLKFKATANSAKIKLEALDQAITAIGEVTLSSKDAIANAKTLYDNLKDEEKATFESTYPGKIATLNQAIAKLSELQVENVKTLISAIGEVNENSYPSIKAARDAYNELTTEQKSGVSNYGTLTKAESDWANVAVVSINKQITNLTDVSDWTVSKGKDTIYNAKTSYETVKSAYEALTTAQQGQVNNYSKVTNGLTKIGELLNEIDFTTELSKITDASALTKTECQSIVDLYNKLTTAQKAQYAENATYKAVMARLETLNNQSIVAIFTKGDTSLASDAGFTVNGKKGYKGTSQTFTYNGKEYDSPLKLQSGDTVTFSTAVAMKVVIKLHTGGSSKITLDGTSYTADSDGIITINSVAAGNHTIGRDGEAWLCYVELAPAA